MKLKNVIKIYNQYWLVHQVYKSQKIYQQFYKRRKIPHNVLNAKNHELEADIIKKAGKPGAVTIATNMAGKRDSR